METFEVLKIGYAKLTWTYLVEANTEQEAIAIVVNDEPDPEDFDQHEVPDDTFEYEAYQIDMT
jgi:hypothetical protein